MTKEEIKAHNKAIRAMKKRNDKKLGSMDTLNSFFGFK